MKTTTKIVGAVVGVLLVAALFTGAAAANWNGEATDNPINLGDIEVWKIVSPGFFEAHGMKYPEIKDAVWENNLGNTVQFRLIDGVGYYLAGNDIVEGKYYYTPITKKEEGAESLTIIKEILMINVKYPGAAAITGSVQKLGETTPLANLAGANVDVDKFFVKLEGFATDADTSIAWTNPDGTLTTTTPSELGIKVTGTGDVTFKDLTVSPDLGEYTIQKVIATAGNNTVAGNYVTSAPFPLLGAPTTFTLYNSKAEYKLTALSEEVLEGNLVTVAFEAPYNKYAGDGTGYYVVVENGTIPTGQIDVNVDANLTGAAAGTAAWISVGLDGYKTFVVKSANTDNIKVTAYDKKADGKKSHASLTIKVVPGKISAEAVPAITNIGNEIDIIGTNELGGKLNVFMKGENYFKEITNNTVTVATKQVQALDKEINGKEFTVTLKTGDLKADAGYYTLYLAKLNTASTNITSPDDLAKSANCSAYTTISIKLVPSFISITEMPTYAVKGEDFVIKGVAEGKPTDVMWYVFGNNYYDYATETVEDDNTFEITIKPNSTDSKSGKEMEAGQYFLVIQHPMYNGQYNVAAKEVTESGAQHTYIFQNKTVGVTGTAADTKLLEIVERQTTNAAYALCKAIDGDEDIDDMYVKRSFNVVDKSSIINAIPGQVAQGDALVVSGTARGYKDAAVAVTISAGGAFDATSKNDAGEAIGSFAEVTTVGKDGSWSVNFDTANIPVGEYKVTVKVGDASTSEGKDLKVVQGTTPKPTQTGAEPTTAPTTAPTQTPASPGFGILAALAGLGAVAVLLLRRQ